MIDINTDTYSHVSLSLTSLFSLILSWTESPTVLLLSIHKSYYGPWTAHQVLTIMKNHKTNVCIP